MAVETFRKLSTTDQRFDFLVDIALVLFVGIAFSVYRRIKNDNKIIAEQKTLLEQSLGEKENLLKEIHHRVKNNLQIISGLFDKQARQVTDEATKKLMKAGQDRVFSIALVHQNLYQSENLTTIEIKSYLEMRGLTFRFRYSKNTLFEYEFGAGLGEADKWEIGFCLKY